MMSDPSCLETQPETYPLAGQRMLGVRVRGYESRFNSSTA
jgi:hypothetical protein